MTASFLSSPGLFSIFRITCSFILSDFPSISYSSSIPSDRCRSFTAVCSTESVLSILVCLYRLRGLDGLNSSSDFHFFNFSFQSFGNLSKFFFLIINQGANICISFHFFSFFQSLAGKIRRMVSSFFFFINTRFGSLAEIK